MLENSMIGLFCDVFPPILDGVSFTVKNYADCMHAKGEDVHVVTPFVPGRQVNPPYPIHHYSSLPIPMRKPYRMGIPQIDAAFAKEMRGLSFDIIHTHSPFSAGKLALNIARQKGIPVVATFHSKFRQDFERAVHLKPVVDVMVNNIVSFFEKVDEVWVPQASVADVIHEYGFKGNVEIVDNGNDLVSPVAVVQQLRDDMRQQLRLKDKETMLLFVGQHIWEKNVGFILESLALIKHLPYKLYMVGTGYAVPQIRTMIHTLGLQDKVTMVGNIPDRDLLKRYYAAADMFLFPSLYDNAPLVVREAAAMHTPALMLQDSTAAEIIQPDHNGFLCENNITTYATLIQHLMENPQILNTVGDNASTSIARSWENVVEEVLTRYADIQKRYKQGKLC